MEWGNVSDKNDLSKEYGVGRGKLRHVRSPKPQARNFHASVSRHFTDQFIFRPVLARILIPYYRKLTMNVDNAKKIYVTQN